MNTRKRIYLDNSASTPLDERVYRLMEPYWLSRYGNAGSIHEEGRQAKEAISAARTKVARALGSRPEEVVFTSGGTEANNLAVIGLYRKLVHQGVKATDIHMITSTIEHSSVKDCFRALEAEGVATTYVPVDETGKVNPKDIQRACTENTALVSIMQVSNEIGSIEPLREIRQAIRARFGTHAPLLHTDASQAPAWLSVQVHALGVDLLTLDAQKVYGPKGAGCLFKARGVELDTILYGGNQEFGLRPGTPPTPLLVGFGEAIRLVEEERNEYVPEISRLRDQFMELLVRSEPRAVINGPLGDERLANSVNLSFPGLDAECIVVELDVAGIAASTRSACLVGDKTGSYVVAALGKDEATAQSAVRFTLSRHSTEEEIVHTAQVLGEIVKRLYNEK